MNQLIAVVNYTGDIATPESFTMIEMEPLFNLDRQTFINQWNEAQKAAQEWEQFSENFLQILLKTGLVDENGLHLDEYTPGSVCRFILANKTMLPESFRDSPMGMMVMSAIKSGAKAMKTGKDIEVNWEVISAHAGPMAGSVLNQMIKSPKRADYLKPILEKYFTLPIPADQTHAN